ncbi:MAG: histidinol-phosphatase [Synergistaceae bacterium]|nr:histidinol-phosphatase [Synergistaceae bacterium]
MTGELEYFWVDLHIHTVLSPCGELEMGARDIVERARKSRLDIIAISDHNTCENYPAVASIASGNPVVFPAIEAQSSEDIHVLSIFPDYDAAMLFKEWLWLKMPSTPNRPDVFGHQVVVDSNDDIVRMEDVLLLQGAGYDVDTIVRRSGEHGAITLLAHVDRPSFAYPAVLGPFPDDYPVDAFELSCRLNSDEAEEWRKKYPKRTFIRSSDSHTLDTMSRGNCAKMLLGAPTFEEIRLALRGEEGRRVSWPWG